MFGVCSVMCFVGCILHGVCSLCVTGCCLCVVYCVLFVVCCLLSGVLRLSCVVRFVRLFIALLFLEYCALIVGCLGCCALCDMRCVLSVVRSLLVVGWCLLVVELQVDAWR